METLGLSGIKRSEDNFFQRLFWPTVQSHYDVDTLSRRGFWLATIVGLTSSVVLLVHRHPLIGLFNFLVFILGAFGIRELSTAASAIILAIYSLGILFQWALALLGTGQVGNPLVTLICIALLASSFRATLLSKRLLLQGDDDVPEASGAGFMSTLSDRLPHRIWPRTRAVFFIFAGLYLALSVVGEVRTLLVLHASSVTTQTVDQQLDQ